VGAMASAIAALLTDDGQWQSYSRSAAEMVADRFDIRTQSARLEDYYDTVLAAHGAGRERQLNAS